jgi:hypothetical protein
MERIDKKAVFSDGSDDHYPLTGPIFILRTERNHRIVLLSSHPNGSQSVRVNPGECSEVMVSVCCARVQSFGSFGKDL